MQTASLKTSQETAGHHATPAQLVASEILSELRRILTTLPVDPATLELNSIEVTEPEIGARKMVDLKLGDGRSLVISIWGRAKK